MAALLMSSTEFAKQMEEAGIPRAQADVIAKGLATMVVHNFDALVTKDYLDTRFGEFEARLGREMDRRFHQMDQRFADLESRMDLRFARVNLMLGVVLVAVAIPALQSLFALV